MPNSLPWTPLERKASALRSVAEVGEPMFHRRFRWLTQLLLLVVMINRLLLLLVVQSFATAYNAVCWLTNHLQLDTATVGPHFIQTTRFYEVEIAYSFQPVVDGPCQTL